MSEASSFSSPSITRTMVTGAIAAFAVVGSIYMYSRLKSIEQKVNTKTQKIDEQIEQMEMKVRDSYAGSNKNKNGSSLIDAKINSIDQTMK